MVAWPHSKCFARLLFLSVLLLPAAASAQFDTAQISGVIQDSSGGVLPGVDVSCSPWAPVSSAARSPTKVGSLHVSQRSGRRLPHQCDPDRLRSGRADRGSRERGDRYQGGHRARARRARRDHPGRGRDHARVDTASIGRTGARRADRGDGIERPGRVTQVAQFVPGAIGNNMGNFATATGTFATGITSINGGRSDEFMATVDGAPSIRVRAAGGFTMGMQNLDTVEEVQVLTTNYQAEFGRSSAGQLRLVTKSGTQAFRGNVFWSGQDDALNANTWTNNRAGIPKSPVSFNQYRLHCRRSHLCTRPLQHRPHEVVLLLGRGMGPHSLR